MPHVRGTWPLLGPWVCIVPHGVGAGPSTVPGRASGISGVTATRSIPNDKRAFPKQKQATKGI